jgi:transcriptional regulator with XRE-family HTH domain
LAEAIGVRFQQVQKYEAGINKLSAARLWRVAAAMEVSLSYFFEGFNEVKANGGTDADRQLSFGSSSPEFQGGQRRT